MKSLLIKILTKHNPNKFLQRTQQSWAAEERRYVARIAPFGIDYRSGFI